MPPPLFTRPFALVFAANLFQGVAFNLFLHFPGFLDQLGADEAEIGRIFGVTALVAVVLRPKIGQIMDARGRRAVILAGNFLNVAVIGLYFGIHDLGFSVYAVRVVHGFAEAMLFTSLFTYAADQVPPERIHQGLAVFGVSGMLTISLGGLLGDWILARSGYPLLFAVALGLAVLALLTSLPLRDAPRPVGRGEAPPRGFWAALSQPDLLPLWWISMIFAIALAAVFTFFKTFVLHTGIGSVGGFFSAYTAVAIALRVFLGWLPDRVGPPRVLYPALVVLASGFGMLAAADSARDVLVAGMLCGAGHGFAFPILFGLVVSRARDAERGSVMAIYTGLFDVGLLVGGPTLGFAITRFGYSAMFASAGLLVLAGALVFARWEGRRPVPV